MPSAQAADKAPMSAGSRTRGLRPVRHRLRAFLWASSCGPVQALMAARRPFAFRAEYAALRLFGVFIQLFVRPCERGGATRGH